MTGEVLVAIIFGVITIALAILGIWATLRARYFARQPKCTFRALRSYNLLTVPGYPLSTYIARHTAYCFTTWEHREQLCLSGSKHDAANIDVAYEV